MDNSKKYSFENGLINYQNYGVFINILNGYKPCINTKDINKNTWNDYFNSLHSILLDGIDTDIIQLSKVDINFDNKIVVSLSLVDLWINLIMWRLIIYTDQEIKPKHLFYSKYITKKEIKTFIDEYCIEVNKRNIDNTTLNGIISDCLTEISKIDAFSFYLANTFNLEDFISIMREDKEFYNLIHANYDNVPLEDIKTIGNKNTNRLIEIMNERKIYNPYGKDYEHCLAIPLAIGEGINAKQFREFAVVEGTKPNNEGGIFPHAIKTSFITGGISDPYDYYMDANAARIAQILQKENVGSSGRFARLLGLNNIDTWLHDDPNFDCHTKNFIDLYIPNERVLKMIDSRWYRNSDNGIDHLINAKEDKTKLVGKYIKLRSPMTCASAAHGTGICYKCYGELAYVNKIINPGRFASEKLSAELTQRLLSAKHLLETVIKKIQWCAEFYNFMEINSNCITMNQEIPTKGFFMLIDPDDLDFENDDIENVDSEEDSYNEYVKKFYIKTPSGEEICIYSETDDKLYISNTLNGIIRKKSSKDNGRFSIPFSVIQNELLFFIVLHNNDLMKALDDVKDCIDKNDITKGKGMTKDKLLNKFIDTIITSNLSIQSVHLEVILMNQIRDLDDVLEKPNWEYPNASYQLLTMKQALDKNQSVTVSLLNERLEKMFYMPLTFKKTKPSFIDLFFMEQPQMYINNDYMIDESVEYKDFTANEGINKKLVSPVQRVAKEEESED